MHEGGALALNDRQRLALLYMRHNQRMTNSDYQRIHRVDRLLARRELQDMVGAGAAEMRGIRGGAHYELSAGTGAVARSGEALRREAVLRHMAAHGEIANRECRELLGLPSAQAAWRLLSVMVSAEEKHYSCKKRYSNTTLRGPTTQIG